MKFTLFALSSATPSVALQAYPIPSTSIPADGSKYLACGEIPTPYQHVTCDSELLYVNPGLIISGQGGSATRAAQEVVQLAGTHDFGPVDEECLDSCCARWGDAFVLKDRVLNVTGTVDYNVEDIPSELRATVEMQTCKTLTMLNGLRRDPSQAAPWAMKEPWLRMMLPFYTSTLDVKFVHVTRDVRAITNTHGDEVFNHQLDPVEELAQLAYTLLPHDTIQETLAVAETIFLRTKNMSHVVTHMPVEDVQKYALFAHVWAVIELTLFKSWIKTRPSQYFHISEKKMVDAATNKDVAKALANFLGDNIPSEDKLSKMTGVYQLEQPTEDKINHWNMMQAIVREPSSVLIREALATFGYDP